MISQLFKPPRLFFRSEPSSFTFVISSKIGQGFLLKEGGKSQ